MPAPVIRQFLGTIPDKGQAQSPFDTNVDAFLEWQALQFAPDLVAFGVFADATAAALVAANLPSLTGRQFDAVRVNAAANGVEFADVTTFGWALLANTSFSDMRTTLGLGTAALQTANVVALAVADPNHLARAGQVVTYVAQEKVSPTFTGVPAAPTAAAATNTTQIATTAMVQAAIAAGAAAGTVTDVTGSRAHSTSYQNAGTRPFLLILMTNGAGNIYFQTSPDNSTWTNITWATGAGAWYSTTVAIPATGYWRINGAATIALCQQVAL